MERSLFSKIRDRRLIEESQYFNKEWYCSRYNIRKNQAAKHYLNIGWQLGYDPSALFSSKKYLEINPDVTEINPLLHYEKYGKYENRNIGSNALEKNENESIYFDEKWYRKKYAIPKGESALRHYYNVGWKFFYDPSIYFSTAGYLYEHSDVAVSGINPLLHYERCGNKEIPTRKIYTQKEFEKVKKGIYSLVCNSEFFDDKWYHDTYQIDEKIDGVLHYVVIGSRLQYNPSIYFSECVYKRYYNLQDSECSLIHYEQTEENHTGNVYLPVENLEKKKNNLRHYFDYQVNATHLLELKKECVPKKKYRHTESVDIIICVYNAYEDVKKCMESVFEVTSEPYRIIIVDDNSAELTKNYLEKIAEEHDNVLLIRNESDNHGYTYAANIGLHASTAEYNVLLNSDTIVSRHWIDNMILCAKTRCADLVGPLSNTASWQSIPKLTDEDGDWCHNVLPEFITIHEMADLVERESGRLYPEVPLLNGFCLMVSRNAINSIGYFDEENFGRGFAEEDDYTSRARKAELKLAIADDTYIYHAQSKSYSDAKRLELCKISGERLREKHGIDYIEDCCKIMYSNFILDSIRCRTAMNFERMEIIKKGVLKFRDKRILFLLPTTTASGGANVIIQEAQSMLKMGMHVEILNLEKNKVDFRRSYHDLNIPVTYVKSFKSVKKIAEKFDVICCSLYSTVKFCKFNGENISTKIAYYIQDYEPYFFDKKNSDYYEAVESYTLLPNCVNVTKTTWNANEVMVQTGSECTVIGPSVNIDLFRPRKMWTGKERVEITAMIRPMTPRRGPEMTWRVLREIAKKYKDQVVINVFGCDASKEYETALFFNKVKLDFPFTNYGLLSPAETAILLGKTDIFIDLSTFQAMGLTAMEAMASGCATVLPKYGGTIDFAKNKINSLVIDTLNFEECKRSIESLIDDYSFRNSLAQKAYQDMCQYYPEKSAYRFLNAIFE